MIRRCRRAGFEPRLAGRLFSHEALLYAIQRGLGVTLLPSFVPAPPGTVELRPLARRRTASCSCSTARRR